jgi:hypothetical protein
MQPEILLSTVEREPATLAEDGENVELIWKPDGTQLIVLTNLGYIHFYDVIFPNSFVF